MAKLERTYIVPLRRVWQRVPPYRRAPRAVRALRDFLERHMKSDNVKLGLHLNNLLWSRGKKSPPHKVKVNVVKEEDGTVKAELFGKDLKETFEAKTEERQEKKEEKKEIKAQKEEKKEAKQETALKTEIKSEPKAEKKPEAKAEPKKETAKEEPKKPVFKKAEKEKAKVTQKTLV